jgi:hypothetical protein
MDNKQKLNRILWNHTPHYRVRKGLSLVPVPNLDQTSSVYALSSYFSIYTLILSSHLAKVFQVVSFFPTFTPNCVGIYLHMICPSPSPACHLVTRRFLLGGIFRSLSQPWNWRAISCRPSATYYCIYSQLLSLFSSRKPLKTCCVKNIRQLTRTESAKTRWHNQCDLLALTQRPCFQE